MPELQFQELKALISKGGYKLAHNVATTLKKSSELSQGDFLLLSSFKITIYISLQKYIVDKIPKK